MIIYEKLFTEEECKKIMDLINGPEDVFEKSIKYEGKDLFKYRTYGIYYGEKTKWIIDRMIEWFFKNNTLIKKPNYTPNDFVINCYSTGDYFRKHIDKSVKYPKRDVNMGIMLTQDFDGGDYICYTPNNEPIVIPKSIGMVLGYSSDVPHEITKITSGERWSLVFIADNILDKKIQLI